MKRFFLMLLVFCLGYFANTQAEVYQVEMLIFSHLTSQHLDEEQWPLVNSSDFNFSNAQPIHPLPSSKFVLNREQADLNKNSAYQALLHVAWRQQIVNGRRARARWIKGKDVQGTVRISVQRYFDVSLNLLFNKEGVGCFYLSQNRRMRNNELDYIDFPSYGVLIKIVPIRGLSRHSCSDATTI